MLVKGGSRIRCNNVCRGLDVLATMSTFLLYFESDVIFKFVKFLKLEEMHSIFSFRNCRKIITLHVFHYTKHFLASVSMFLRLLSTSAALVP